MNNSHLDVETVNVGDTKISIDKYALCTIPNESTYNENE